MAQNPGNFLSALNSAVGDGDDRDTGIQQSIGDGLGRSACPDDDNFGVVQVESGLSPRQVCDKTQPIGRHGVEFAVDRSFTVGLFDFRLGSVKNGLDVVETLQSMGSKANFVLVTADVEPIKTSDRTRWFHEHSPNKRPFATVRL